MAPEGVKAVRALELYLRKSELGPALLELVKLRASLMNGCAYCIAQADGLLLVTPEYNNSIPGVLKNAIDWLSRPADDIPRVFRGRPVAIMGATIGSGGTALSQAAWLSVVRFLGMRPWFERAAMISDAGTVFDSEGHVVDAATRQRIRAFVEGFAAFAGAQGAHVAIAPAPQPNVREGVVAGGPRERVVTTLRMGETR
ncbi:MAG: NAD(P)H-dependent oxidoreductase [Burkholderiales bacterium]